MIYRVDFLGVIYKVQNVADGGFRFSFDTPDKIAAAYLIPLSDQSGTVKVIVEFLPSEMEQEPPKEILNLP